MKPLGLLGGVSGYARFRALPGRMSFPDVTCNLVWARGRVWLHGPETRGVLTKFPGEEIELLAIAPQAARLWLGAPLTELTDMRIALAEFDRRLADEAEALFVSGQTARLVGAAAAPANSPDPAMQAAEQGLRRGVGVASVAGALDISPRQFARRFADATGMSPRRFVQIVRFRRAAEAVQKRGLGLAAAAQVAGYADQPHFTRAAQALMGRSPGQFLPRVGIVQDRAVGRW